MMTVSVNVINMLVIAMTEYKPVIKADYYWDSTISNLLCSLFLPALIVFMKKLI